jgi:branched-subunit amino acid ABC-type transport system permease component
MEFFTISMLNGLSYGLLLFMLSSGLTLIFSMMGVLNFAHASCSGPTSPTRLPASSASGPA